MQFYYVSTKFAYTNSVEAKLFLILVCEIELQIFQL